MSDELTFCKGRYESLKLLGRGAHGKLYLVRDRCDGIKKALKQIFNCDREIKKEARILRELAESSCPHIVKYYDSFDETDFFNIVFEYHRFGDLTELIDDEIHKGNKRIPSETILNWSRQLLEALDLIHSKNIIHRDVKPHNFGNIILADFGVSVHPNTMNNTFTGTINYMSPEMLQGEAYGFATDIWSFGCVVYELFTLKMAFKGEKLFQKIVGCEIDFPSFENEPDIEFLIKKCIRLKPDERLKAKELLLKTQEKKKNVNSDPSNKVQKYFEEGQLFIEDIKYKDALKCFEKSLWYLEEFKAVDKIEISNTLDKIGECYLLLLDYDNALEYCNQAYEMRKDFSQITENIHLFNSLISLGDCYFFCHRYKKNFKKALEFYLESHEMIKRINSKNSNKYQSDLAKSFGRIGNCYYYLNEDEKSLEYNFKSLEIYQQIHKNEDNKDLAQALNQVGNSYSWHNDPQKGLAYNLKALEMRRRLFGSKDHIDTARSLHDIGINYSNLNDEKTALKYRLESLEMRERLYSFQDHPMIALCLLNVAASYDKLGEYKKALDFDFKALEMKKRLFKNKDDDLTLLLFNNIANTYNKLNDEENYSKYNQLADDLEKKLKL